MIKLPLTSGEAELIQDVLACIGTSNYWHATEGDEAILKRLHLRIGAKLDNPES